MKKTDQAVQILLSEIENRQILEVACGRAEFTYSASDYTQSVSCIDLDDSKLNCAKRDNIHFEIMDAARMRFPDETFDTVFCTMHCPMYTPNGNPYKKNAGGY